MSLPTEPIGSMPRPPALMAAMLEKQAGRLADATFQQIAEDALKDTIQRLEATGSPVITDGEQTKPSFVTYPLSGIGNLAPGGVVIPFVDGHTRQLPRLTAGPFRYGTYASEYLAATRRLTTRPVKQAVISASALSLLYPPDEIPGYPREVFLSDLVGEAVKDIRGCLDGGTDSIQIDFTEGRLSLKLDPSGGLLGSFVALINRVLDHFSPQEIRKIGVHTCPGGGRYATHSADVDYAGLLPSLFKLRLGRFYVQMASERDPGRVLEIIRRHLQPEQMVFVGVVDPIGLEVETAERVRDRTLHAAKYLPVAQLGTTDDCGFAPFADDTSTSRDVAFAKIRARVEGTMLASRDLTGS